MNKKNLFILIVTTILLVIIVGIFFFWKSNKSYETVGVQQGDVIQEIFASGKVEASSTINLHFKNSGQLAVLNAKIGSRVSSGKLLASQDTSELDAQVREMQAGINLQKAKLAQLLSGASEEDVELAEIKLENARRKLYSDDLVATSDDDTRRDIVPIITGIYNGTQEGSYKLFFKDFNDLSNRNIISFIGLEKGMAEKDDLPQKFGTKGLFISFPEDSYQFDDRWVVDIPNKSGVNFVSNLNAYNSAQAELNFKKASIRSSDVAVYEAQISQADASLEKIQAQKRELMIFAPMSGTITEVNGEIGENVGPDTTVVSMVTGDVLHIKLNVVEDNIVNVKVGQEARIIFDAIQKEEFRGKVASIDPAETIIGGAVYYQTVIVFDTQDERIKSGMTANVWVETDISRDTLFVPISVIQNKDDGKIVQVLEGNKIKDREVKTGITNSSGMIEITSGLLVGEQVVMDKK